MRPWRSPGPERPALAVPPAHMPLVRAGRPLKAWRWVGVFGAELELCAASARVGPARLAWWAVWDRETGVLRERSHRRAGPVALAPGRVRVAAGDVAIDLALDEDAGVETISPHGRSYIWTRKQGGIRARGTVTLAGRARALDARAIVDDSAGYHARRTAWRWAAGVGIAADGARVAWNLVAGLHDARAASERTIWIDGAPHEVAPVRFDGLGAVAFAEGGELRFAAEAVRARRENLLLIRSDYEQPFGTFRGELPGAGPLREAYGVMERHEARW
jgi:Protein of unknown function (DUF2804)